MPQETALSKLLSIEEMLYFFGRLNFLETDFIEERINFLLNKLEIPDRKRIIGSLSGGQQRRVNLNIMLIQFISSSNLDITCSNSIT